jgi:hypothetical protein|tara:strand:+ start:709 stop:1017 length:309 start_codon:yes stop_codon:yes gene_type:complete
MKYTSIIKLLPKNYQEKYDDRVMNKAIDLTDYDLLKNNKSSEDISEEKYERMVAKNMEKVIDGHNNKVKNTLLNITGLSLISNVWRKGIGGVFGGGDDDEEV